MFEVQKKIPKTELYWEDLIWIKLKQEHLIFKQQFR